MLLKNMVGTTGLEPATSTVSTGRTVRLGAICYQIATKNMPSGFGGRIVGDRPLCFHTFVVHPREVGQRTARRA